MKFPLCLAVFAASLAGPSVGCAAPAPRYEAVRDLGAPLASTQLLHGVVTHVQGRPVFCTTVSGSVGKFNVFDLENDRVLKSFDIPAGKTFWIHDKDSKGDVFFAGYVKATLYHYSVEKNDVVDVGALFGEQAACAITVDEQDNIYLGTFPNAKVVKYDRASGKLVDLGTKLEGEKYIKALAHHDGYLYAGGIKERTAFARISLQTGKVEKLPGASPDVSAYNTFRVVDDLLFAHVSLGSGNAGALRVYDLRAKKWLDFNAPEARGMSVTDAIDGKIYYSAANYVWSFDLKTRAAERTAMPYTTGFRSSSITTLSKDARFKEPSFVNAFFGGTIAIYNFKTGAVKSYNSSLDAAEGVVSEVINFGSDLLVGEFMGTRLAVFDPAAKRTKSIVPMGQAESALESKGKFYFGVYPAASVEVYDPSQPVEAKKNPRVLFDLKKQGQSRPYGLAISGDKLVTGMIADYGLTQGALAVYDLKTGKLDVFKNILPDQNFTSLVAGPDGLVYGTTTINGGLGGTPRARAAQVFAFDPRSGKIVRSREVKIPGVSQPITTFGGACFGPDGLLWLGSYGTVLALKPGSLEVAKHVDVNSTNWASQPLSWGRAAYHFNKEGYLIANPGHTLVQLDPRTLKWESLLPSAHDRRVGQSTLAANGDIYFLSDVNNSRLFHLPRKR